MPMLYYANGGPGPADELMRVDAPDEDDSLTRMEQIHAWLCAPADKWTARSGWQPYPHAQGEISQLGWMSMIDASEVERVQQEIRDR